jgi:iron complex outermembrane receptor protein
MLITRNKILTTSLVAMAAHISSAYAADVPQAAPATPATQSAAKPADNGNVAEVIVTATKRSTSLLKTPLAVTALSGAALDDAHVKNLEDLTHLSPSFQATSQGDHAVLLLTMRGIGNDGAKTEQADPEVSVYVDGVYSPRAEGATALLYDMDRVEVMRGPQGTLWGRNSTAGAVNMVSAKPKFGMTEGSAEITVGNYNRTGTRFMYNLPITEQFALRVAYAGESHDGYVDYQQPPNIPGLDKNAFVTSGDKYNAQDQKALRLSAAWQPTSSLRTDLSFETFRDDGTPSMNLNQEPRPGQKLWSALIQIAPYLHRKVDTIRTRTDWNVNQDIDLAFIAGAQRTDGAMQFDARGGYTVPTSNTTGGVLRNTRINWEHYTNASAELNVKSSGKKTVDWLVGAYVFHEKAGIRLDQPAWSGTQAGYGCTNCGWPALTQNSFVQPNQDTKSHAFFTQNTWNVSETFRLTGGLRKTWDEKHNRGGTNFYCPTTQPANGKPCLPITAQDDPRTVGFVPNPSVIGPDGKPALNNDGQHKWSKPTWLLKADYDVTKDIMAYASVSTGYKSGVLTDGGVHTAPETLTSYELGAKGKLMGGKVTWATSIYYADFKGYQISVPTTFPNGASFLLTANAKGATAKGFEGELTARVTPVDTLNVAMAIQRTEMDTLLTADPNNSSYNNLPGPNGTKVRDLKGNELPHAPHFSLNVGYQRHFNLESGARISPRINMHYETASWLDVFNDGDPDRQKAYTRSDFTVRYKPAGDKHWQVEAFVQNLENKDIKTTVNIVNLPPAASDRPVWQAMYLAPRTFGVRLTADF